MMDLWLGRRLTTLSRRVAIELECRGRTEGGARGSAPDARCQMPRALCWPVKHMIRIGHCLRGCVSTLAEEVACARRAA